jgi:hypothetical protein
MGSWTWESPWGREGKTWGERDGRRTEASFITY